MRLRIPELLATRPDMTAYQLAKESGGRISMSTAYRLLEKEGRVQNFDADMLEALCDIFRVEPGPLFVREADDKRAAAERPAGPKRRGRRPSATRGERR